MRAWGLVAIAVAGGLLEAAWTRPEFGGPMNTWLGVAALLIIFGVASYPRIYWVPGLAILEEISHLFSSWFWTGYALPPTIEVALADLYSRTFNHWSQAYIGFNVYPYLLFPILTVAGILSVWVVQHRKRFALSTVDL